nr:JmjC domain-containing protein [Tanacetum cinerariifolium]
YKDEHNKVGYLLKPTGSDDNHQIIDFLRASHIRAPELGPPAILATIDKTPYTITEDLVRSRLQLADDGGIADLPIAKIYSGMDNLGTKSGSWDQFGSPLAVALICLSDGRRFNWSSYIFKGMVKVQRRQTFDPIALVLEHGQSSNPHPASFSQSHETDAGLFTTVEDAYIGDDFYTSPPRSSQAPLAGQPSGGVEDPITLTALSSIVSTLVQNVHSLESELKDHKKLFKDVAGKLVKKVKALEVKLKTKKTKMVVTDSDQEDGGKQDIDLDVPCISTAGPLGTSAVPLGTSAVPPGTFAVPPGTFDVPLSTFIVPLGTYDVPTCALTALVGSPNIPTDVPSSAAPAGVSSKGKSLMVKEDIPVKERTFKQMEEDRLGEEAAKRLHDEEMAQIERQRAEVQRKRQQDVLDSAMYYNKADWLNIRAQVKANASLSKTLLGDDVSEDNFPARMAALIKLKRKALAAKLA